MSVEIADQKSFAAAVADEIVASIKDCIHDRDKCVIALSGGGTPSTIYRLLARPPRVNDVEWEKVHFFWGDERWVPIDHNRSNFRMTTETLLSHISMPKENIHPVDTAMKTPEAAAKAYRKEILDVLGGEEGEPVFDIVLLGLGEDGHIASVFPGSKILNGKGAMCHAIKHPSLDEHRITLSCELLFSARQILFLVKGEGKAEMLRRTLEEEKEVPKDIPAVLYRESQERVTWFVDSAAAKLLENTY